MRLDLSGSTISTTRPTTDICVLAFKLTPATDAGRADTKAMTGFAVVHPLTDRTKNSHTKIN